ncbi:MAG TPA: hypothetical protein EYH34_04105 [Planctomycetes bacterium]|nr:hypothetical protein [Planctomycetota bacterium]
MPLAPGVSELLRAEAELAKTIRPTPLDKLSVITAGRWEPQLQAMLANDAPSVLFEKLRAEYDFVVVDGGPILPVADTRLVGQHVDGVILSILRDVSQAGKVLAACEVLEALGVRSLGAIVWSSPEDVYYAESGY